MRRIAAGMLVAAMAGAGGTAAVAAGGAPARGGAVAAAAGKVYVRDPLTGRLAQRPRTIAFSDVTITRLRWSHWGARAATARGRARVNLCDPSCAAGRTASGPIRVTVRHRVRGHGRRVYRCIEGTISGVPAAARRVSWMCS
jgi:hypothetical protein